MNILLQEILAAREARVQRQQALLARFGLPLVCFTMNIPGPVKDSPAIRRAFEWGVGQLDKQLQNVTHRQILHAVTGNEAFFVVDTDAAALKQLCIAIEESCPLGRLFDMDVLDAVGRKLERPTQRGCMVCGAPGRFCAASRTHSADILQQRVAQIIGEHFSATDSICIASAAVNALLQEVHTTPKPGLVDENNTGSHSDMDIPLFTASAKALQPYFRQCVELGQKTACNLPEETFPLLREAGLKAEKQMFSVTDGVNTHKGAIYTLGILCGAVGRLWSVEKPFGDTQSILDEAARMASPFVKADFAAITTAKTAGEQLYIRHGLTGIRGEAAAGFPSVGSISLPVYRQQLKCGKTPNDAASVTLLYLIAHVEDTNLYHRGGKEGAEFARTAAAALLPEPTPEQLTRLDGAFIERNLSPGGCADLLAATLFLHSLEL